MPFWGVKNTSTGSMLEDSKLLHHQRKQNALKYLRCTIFSPWLSNNDVSICPCDDRV